MMRQKNILLTGATGNMGKEGLKQLYANKDKYHIIVFAQPTQHDKKFLARYKNDDSVSIVWGDLTCPEDVQRAVGVADVVLHVGALVSPKADHQPEKAWKINYGGTKNIVEAIRKRTDSNKVKLMYIGSVAETGNRSAPFHWGRIGDPLVPSAFDNYAISKIAAERYVIESGLQNWVSLRQTGIMHENLLDVNDGIGYHQPLNNHLEWVSAHDSGRLMLKICKDNIPDDFWGNVYNIGGGENCRLTSFALYQKISTMLGIDFRELEKPNWYALRNFHGQYYYDSDKLNDYLNFRTESVDDVLDRIRKNLPLRYRLLKYLPKNLLKNIMHKQALKGDTPLRWIKDKNKSKIKAFFGSIENWHAIPEWEDFRLIDNPPHKKLDHGYDEKKGDKNILLEDIRKAATFRGGKCLSERMERGDLRSKLNWRCAQGHEFEASPYLILKTGHWCPECMQTPWNFDEQSMNNPFLAQVWHADHDPRENMIYQKT